jgi:hypothetical protein
MATVRAPPFARTVPRRRKPMKNKPPESIDLFEVALQAEEFIKLLKGPIIIKTDDEKKVLNVCFAFLDVLKHNQKLMGAFAAWKTQAMEMLKDCEETLKQNIPDEDPLLGRVKDFLEKYPLQVKPKLEEKSNGP